MLECLSRTTLSITTRPASENCQDASLLPSLITTLLREKLFGFLVTSSVALLLRPNSLMQLVVPEDPDPLTPGGALHAVEAAAAARKEP